MRGAAKRSFCESRLLCVACRLRSCSKWTRFGGFANFLGCRTPVYRTPKTQPLVCIPKKIQEKTQISETAVAPCQNLFNSNRPFTHEKKIASSRVSSHPPPNKAPSLMLQIDKCELPHTNLYVVYQSYEFVFNDFVSPRVSSHPPPNSERMFEARGLLFLATRRS